MPERDEVPCLPADLDLQRPLDSLPGIVREDALASWQALVRQGADRHGLDYPGVTARLAASREAVVCVDATKVM